MLHNHLSEADAEADRLNKICESMCSSKLHIVYVRDILKIAGNYEPEYLIPSFVNEPEVKTDDIVDEMLQLCWGRKHFVDSYPHIDRSGSNVSIDERRIIIFMMHLYISTYLTESSLGCQSSQWKYILYVYDVTQRIRQVCI